MNFVYESPPDIKDIKEYKYGQTVSVIDINELMPTLIKKQILFIPVFITIVLTSLTAFVTLTKRQSPQSPPPPAYVKKETKKKIIYNPESDLATIKGDCRERGGTFNSCGSYCEEDEVCIQLCAYTCEFN